MLEDDINIKDISRQLEEGKHLIVTMPFVIRPKDGGEISDEFYIGIKKRSDPQKRKNFGLMQRNYQTLWLENSFYEEAKWTNNLMITVISINPESSSGFSTAARNLVLLERPATFIKRVIGASSTQV